ncbi:cbb3-type cytochrome c oxidase subunit 3 [uncultured Maricaulis sp.]|uniref:cbb3-type cytochrome c oxidase subunit 3 n=2 Tax=Maricaulis TaxID=74317 RepID=UPI0030DA77CF|tara:strand:+ start:18699 stop:18893 length:195 start_codon:yes stop_codon:yes gene_type:complete
MMYSLLASFAQTWGMLLFVALFTGALTYALWPRNQQRFDEAARLPLDDSDEPIIERASEDQAHV